MRRRFKLLAIAVTVPVCVLAVPGSVAVVPLIILGFSAGFLVPDRPVAAGSLMAAVFFAPSILLGATWFFFSPSVSLGAIWFADQWHRYYPLTLNKSLATLIVIGNIAVGYLAVWGWAVFLGYMGAGVALRRQLRAGVPPPAGAS